MSRKIRWRADELLIVERASTWNDALRQLPERTPTAVRSKWMLCHPAPLDQCVVGRPPKTPEERQVAQILVQYRRVCSEAHVQPDVGAFLHALRDHWGELVKNPRDPSGAPFEEQVFGIIAGRERVSSPYNTAIKRRVTRPSPGTRS